MAHRSRIFFKQNGVLRAFYWVQVGPDQSIYFGSSNTKSFTKGVSGTTTIDMGGTTIFPDHDGRSMSHEEISGKTSIHGSGIVNQCTMGDDGRRNRYRIKPLREVFDYLPLIGILPMEPSRYPTSDKTPRKDDFVFELPGLPLHPLGIILYVRAPYAAEPPPITVAKDRLSAFTEATGQLGTLSLCIAVYADPVRMPQWQLREVEALAHPPAEGQEPTWPFFA